MGTGFTAGRIEETLARARAFWRGERRGGLVSVYTAPDYRQNPDPEAMVARACECIRADGASAEENILPCFWPDFGTVTTAAQWGGRIIPPAPGQCIHIEPAARRAEDLAALQPCAYEASDFHRAALLYRRVCERLGTDEVFVRLPDYQGPLNTLALVLDQEELMCSFYDKPDLIHAMLGRVTDVLIESVRRFAADVGPHRLIGGIWPFVILPADMGVVMTEDYLPLISPEAYREFGLPCAKRIADAFGGLWIHCCGRYAPHLPTLRAGGFRIWGLEAAYPQTPVWDVHAVFGEDIAYLVGVSPDGTQEFPTVVEYARAIAERPCARARFWFCTCHGWCDAAALKQVVRDRFGRR
jgi:hypothetical protein